MATGHGTEATPFRWSQAMNRVWTEEVSSPLYDHSGTSQDNNLLFGVPFKVVRTNAIQAGLADFTKGFKYNDEIELSARQVVLSYCHINMKRHFFSALLHFQAQSGFLKKHFDKAQRIVLIDVGCGPATAGLAFAELFPDLQFVYYGVDRAEPMRRQGRRMMRAARDQGMLHDDSTFHFREAWDEIPADFGESAVVVLNFSFFFASPWLTSAEILSLGRLFRRLAKNERTLTVLISYMNSTYAGAHTKYNHFLADLKINPQSVPAVPRVVRFYKNLNATEPNPPEYFRSEIFHVVSL